MKSFLVLSLLVLPFSVPAKAVTIDPYPTLEATRYDGLVTVDSSTNRIGDGGQEKGFGIGGPGTIDVFFKSTEATSTINLDYAPRISTYSGAEPHANGHTDSKSSANLYYGFEIVGPSATSVSVSVLAKGQATTTGLDSTAHAFFSLGGSSGYFAFENISAGADGHAASFEVDRHVFLSSNTEYRVTMSSSTWAASDSSGPLTGGSGAHSFVDPYFAIDPGFSDYHLVFSDGINNTLVSAVPLPAAAPMFGLALLGLGGLGFAARGKSANRDAVTG